MFLAIQALSAAIWLVALGDGRQTWTQRPRPEDATDGRSGKFLPLVRFVPLERTECAGRDAREGVCLSSEECSQNGGLRVGLCAEGFGVCCQATVKCGSDVKLDHTRIVLSRRPCETPVRIPVGTLALKVDLLNAQFPPPILGNCRREGSLLVPAGLGTNRALLCGLTSGSSVHIPVSSEIGSLVISSGSKMASGDAIAVSFLDFRDDVAPPGFLQYFASPTGVMKSFNSDGQHPQMLNNLDYSIGFKSIPGFCNIEFVFSTFDLGSGDCEDDYLLVQSVKLCGVLEPGFVIFANASSEMRLRVFSDSNNDEEQEGFQASYTMLPC